MLPSDEAATAFTPSFLGLLEDAEAAALREAGEILVRLAEDSAAVRAVAGAGEDDVRALPLPEARRRLARVAQALRPLRRVVDQVQARLDLPPPEERDERLDSGDYTPGLGLYVELETLLHDQLDPLIEDLDKLAELPPTDT